MMSNGGEKTYRPWHPEHYRHEAHRPETKLPQDDLVFFLLDTVPKLDLSRFYALYVRIPRESWLLLTFRDAMRTCQNQVNWADQSGSIPAQTRRLNSILHDINQDVATRRVSILSGDAIRLALAPESREHRGIPNYPGFVTIPCARESPMITLHELCAHLLPPHEHLKFRNLILDEHRILLVAAMMAPKAACPDCHQLAVRIHSDYQRKLADLPWATAPIDLRLPVRRFFCTTCTCSRQTFTERLPTVASLYARTTTRLTDTQAQTGLAPGGAAGARRLTRPGWPVSRRTMLRRVRRLALPDQPPPRVVGVDDWAWRTGHRYGTMIVDLERNGPIDVLEDRLAETVAAWLQAHPEVEVVARDRAEAYGAGIRQGAPDATQVADRFHLFQNWATALQEVFSVHHREIDARHDAKHNESQRLVDGSIAVSVEPPVATSRMQQQIAHNRTKRVADYEQAHEWRQQGWTIKAIASHLGRHRRTVNKYLQASTFSERPPRRRRVSILDPSKAYLLERWNAGCHRALELCHEMQSQGFQGKYSIVADDVSRLRPAQGRVAKHRKSGSSATIIEADKPLTPREATWLVMRREAKLNADEKQQLAALPTLEGEVGEAIAFTRDFVSLVRQRQPDQLDSWLERAAASWLQALKSLAKGWRADDEVVKAGVTLPWSTGPVEGQINRLKMLKRQMYGRANIDLLRQRVVLPTSAPLRGRELGRLIKTDRTWPALERWRIVRGAFRLRQVRSMATQQREGNEAIESESAHVSTEIG